MQIKDWISNPQGDINMSENLETLPPFFINH